MIEYYRRAPKIAGKNLVYSLRLRPHAQSLWTITGKVQVVFKSTCEISSLPDSFCSTNFATIGHQEVILREMSGDSALNSSLVTSYSKNHKGISLLVFSLFLFKVQTGIEGRLSDMQCHFVYCFYKIR